MKEYNILFMDFRFYQNSGLTKRTKKTKQKEIQIWYFSFYLRSIVGPAEHFFKTLFIRLWHLSRFINYRYWTHCLCVCYRKIVNFCTEEETKNNKDWNKNMEYLKSVSYRSVSYGKYAVGLCFFLNIFMSNLFSTRSGIRFCFFLSFCSLVQFILQ